MDRITIEKAADVYADKAPKSYCNGDYGKYAIADAFEEGAKWRINSVWHDGREIPSYKRDFIYQSILKSGKVCLGMKMLFGDDEWDFMKKFCVIERWAYVDDLLPDRKEVQL